jgi:outer membrane receptor protein involved in Fe transport
MRGGLINAYFNANAETNWKQTRIDPRDVAPPGSTIASVGAGVGRLMPRGVLTVDLSMKNVFDTQYRSFMSRYKEFALGPGRVVVLRVTTSI